MSMVRFATTCDVCQARSEEYTSFPTCRECDAHVCPAHVAPGTLRDADLDSPATCVCTACATATAAA